MDAFLTHHTPDPGLRILLARSEWIERWGHQQLAPPYWRCYHALEDGAAIKYRSSRVNLGPDHLILIAPDTPCDHQLLQPLQHGYIHFLMAPMVTNVVWTIHVDDSWRGWIQQWHEADNHHPLASSAALMSLLFQALTCLPDQAIPYSSGDDLVDRCTGLLRAHLQDGIGNDALAAALGMHPHALGKRFKRRCGCGPQSFLQDLRVREAASRLHHSDDSLEDIAGACGFYDRYHLGRVFKKRRGISPAAFRRQR